jgi:hypothetical protein
VLAVISKHDETLALSLEKVCEAIAGKVVCAEKACSPIG